MIRVPAAKRRCAVYTRKSSEERLDQDFNSLDAQREACAAYIARSYEERVDSELHCGKVRLLDQHLTLEARMPIIAANQPEAPTAIRTDLGAIFVSLELSRSKWLITSLSPGGGEKMSKHSVAAGDVAGILARFAGFNRTAQARTGRRFPIIVIQEVGLDGFWIHRVLQAEGIESHVVDPASITTS